MGQLSALQMMEEAGTIDVVTMADSIKSSLTFYELIEIVGRLRLNGIDLLKENVKLQD